MTRVLKAEFLKLTRPRVLAGTFLAVLGAALVATSVAVFAASATQAPGDRGVSLADLRSAGGGTEAFSLGMSFTGFFVFVTLGANWAAEFSQGTFRTLLMKQPRRLDVLAGKLFGLIAFAAAVLVLFEGLTWVLSLAFASIDGLPTSAWFSWAGIEEGGRDYLDALFGVSAWSTFAMMLGVLLRSTPLALGVGIAWAGPFEHLTERAWSALDGLYPGLLLERLMVGGTPDVSYTHAVVMLTAYVAAAVAISLVAFVRRDVAA